jgi:hypothetical protein
MDHLPRMKDTMLAEDMNTDGCIRLVSAILDGATQDLASAAVRTALCPSKGNYEHLRQCRAFYASDWFVALSNGMADGPSVAKKIEREALARNGLLKKAEGIQA